MTWVVTDPAFWTSFNNGTFESGGTGSFEDGHPTSCDSASTDQHQGGTRSFKLNLAGKSAYVSQVGSYNRRYNLFSIQPGKAITAGRRYQIKIYMKITNPGQVASTHAVRLACAIGNNLAFPASGYANDLDFRSVYGSTAFVQASYIITAGASYTAAAARIAFAFQWNYPVSPSIPFDYPPPMDSVVYFDTATITEEEDQVVAPLVITSTKTDVTTPGGSDGSIDLTVSGGVGGPYNYFWTDDPINAQDRTGLPAATYTVRVVDSLSGAEGTHSVTILPMALMTASATVSNPTSDGATDGGITLVVAGGSGSRSYLWGDGPTTANRSGLPEGTYHVTITDLVSGQVIDLDVVLSDPGPPVYPGSFLDVPTMQSLHAVVLSTIDACDNPQQLDNALFCQQVHPYYSKCDYPNKVAKCDGFPYQWNSDFENFTVTLKDRKTNADVKLFPWELKEQNLGLLEDHDITLRDHTEAGKMRVYFNVGAVPIPLAVGDNFEILNNLDGYDGNYTIVDIIQDVFLGYQYLVINQTWVGPGSTSAATGKFSVATADFNVFEASLSFLDVADGEYYIELKAFNPSLTKTAVTEPIYLKVEHPETNCIDFRNFDNAFGVTWQTGITCRIRIESQFFKRLPGGERVVSRNSNFSLVKVNAKKTRGMLFETFQLPPYLHEKLSCIFDMDFFAINGLECQAADAYSDPQYLTRYPLANSSIKLEVKEWFDRYNSHDIGSISDGGFILTETGFLKR